MNFTDIVMTEEHNNLSVMSGNETSNDGDELDLSLFFFVLPEPYKSIQMINRKYVLLVTAIASLIGNSLIITILSRRSNRHYTTSEHLTNLAVSDLVITASGFLSWFDYNWPLEMSVAACRAIFIFSDIGLFTNPWIMCVISIERAVGVIKPHRVKDLFTVKRARVFSVALWFVVLVMFGTYRQTMSAGRFQGVGDVECKELAKYRPIIYVYNFVYVLFQLLVPYVILGSSTCIIIYVLFKQNIRKSKSGKGQRMSVTKKLLLVNIAFFVLVTPAVVQELNQFFDQLLRTTFYTFEDFLMQNLLLNIFRTLRVINSAINFFIYFFSGSRFRKETMDLLKCRGNQLDS